MTTRPGDARCEITDLITSQCAHCTGRTGDPAPTAPLTPAGARGISRIAFITDGVHAYALEQHYPLSHTMVRIHRAYPHTHYGFADGEHPSARVTVARGPAAIAAEIRRRLAPGYDDVLARIADHDGGVDLATGARGYVAAQITGMFPPGKVHAPGHMQDDYRTEVIVPGASHQGGDVKFCGLGEDVEFGRFRVPAEVALKMLAVYAEHVAGLDPEEVK